MFGIDMALIMLLLSFIGGLVFGVSLGRPGMRSYRPRHMHEEEHYM